MDHPVTGNDAAVLIQTAQAQGIQWATVTSLPGRYRTDPVTRTVYLDGRLGICDYYAALADAVAELVHDNVAVLTPRSIRSRPAG